MVQPQHLRIVPFIIIIIITIILWLLLLLFKKVILVLIQSWVFVVLKLKKSVVVDVVIEPNIFK